MQHVEIANRTGVMLGDLEALLRGKATANVASRLGVSMADIEDFVRGSSSANMTGCLGLTTISAADELARAVGGDGAIGIVLGLLLGSS